LRIFCWTQDASRICDVSHAIDYMVIFPRPSPSIFAYCKPSNTGGVEGLGMRLIMPPLHCVGILPSNIKYRVLRCTICSLAHISDCHQLLLHIDSYAVVCCSCDMSRVTAVQAVVSRFLSVFSSAPDHLCVATRPEKEFVMATNRGRPVGINVGKEVRGSH